MTLFAAELHGSIQLKIFETRVISLYKILSTKFFRRPTLQVAQELLGKFLVRKIGKSKIVGMITEVEAYIGPKDKASHASRGKTPRTEVMFGKPGYWYVYLVYGMHHCLNIVTEKEKYPAAILIRSVSKVTNAKLSHRVCNSYIKGPGRVCKHFKIDKQFNAKIISRKTDLWIEDRGVKISPRRLGRGKRIGVDYAEEWKEKPWRLYLK